MVDLVESLDPAAVGALTACHFAQQVTAQAVEETAATQSVIETAVDVDWSLPSGLGCSGAPT